MVSLAVVLLSNPKRSSMLTLTLHQTGLHPGPGLEISAHTTSLKTTRRLPYKCPWRRCSPKWMALWHLIILKIFINSPLFRKRMIFRRLIHQQLLLKESPMLLRKLVPYLQTQHRLKKNRPKYTNKVSWIQSRIQPLKGLMLLKCSTFKHLAWFNTHLWRHQTFQNP